MRMESTKKRDGLHRCRRLAEQEHFYETEKRFLEVGVTNVHGLEEIKKFILGVSSAAFLCSFEKKIVSRIKNEKKSAHVQECKKCQQVCHYEGEDCDMREQWGKIKRNCSLYGQKKWAGEEESLLFY